MLANRVKKHDGKKNEHTLGCLSINFAMAKHGIENFKEEILHEYESFKEASDQEIFLIANLKSQDKKIGYNITDGGEGIVGILRESKINQEQAKEIHAKFVPRKYTMQMLAEEYETTRGTILKILRCEESYSFCKDFQTKQPIGACAFSKDDAIEINKKFLRGNVTIGSLSEEYGTNTKTIRRALTGEGSYAFCRDIFGDDTINELKRFPEKQIERFKKRIGDKNFFYGKKHSDEAKKKISESHKGKYDGEKNPFYGKTHSLENREKISKNQPPALTQDQAKEIHEKFNPNTYDKQSLAEEYKVTSTTIRAVLKCRSPYEYCKSFQSKYAIESGQKYITTEDCKIIISEYFDKDNPYSQKEFAEKYKVSIRTMHCILNGIGTYKFCKEFLPNDKQEIVKSKISLLHSKPKRDLAVTATLNEIKNKYIPRKYTAKMLAKEYSMPLEIIKTYIYGTKKNNKGQTNG